MQTSLFPDAGADTAPLLSLDWDARRERVKARFEAAVAVVLEHVVQAGYTPRVAFSGGKDSLTTLIVVCEALRRLRGSGVAPPTLHLTSADTRVENPAVIELIQSDHAALRAWGAAQGISVKSEIVGPPLSSDLWVQVIGGRSLPPHRALKRTNCSVDWKVRPSMRATRRLNAALRESGKGESVTLLGTRFDESDRRSARMRMRGESATTVRIGNVDGVEYLTLSPIAEWAQEEVFALLQGVGDGWIPSFRGDHNETLRLYNDAAGFGCVLVPDPGQIKRAKGCGSRLGCWSCLQVEEDRALKNMLMLDEHAAVAPLNALRSVLDRVALDAGMRDTRITSVNLERGTCKVEPGGRLSAQVREDLLMTVLSVQAMEVERAGREGESTRFTILSAEQLVAIDYLWSVDGGHAPHAALRISREVESGARMLPQDWGGDRAAAWRPDGGAFMCAIPAALLRGAELSDDPLACQRRLKTDPLSG